jgi:hypothetical protein
VIEEQNEWARSQVAQKLCTAALAILNNSTVGSLVHVEPSSVLCASLELLIPRLLRLKYPEWRSESLDGVFPLCVHKYRPLSLRLLGTAVLTSDQTVTPVAADIRLNPAGTQLDRIKVGVGVPGGGTLGISGPPPNSKKATQLADTLLKQGAPTWVYKLTWPRKV